MINQPCNFLVLVIVAFTVTVHPLSVDVTGTKGTYDIFQNFFTHAFSTEISYTNLHLWSKHHRDMNSYRRSKYFGTFPPQSLPHHDQCCRGACATLENYSHNFLLRSKSHNDLEDNQPSSGKMEDSSSHDDPIIDPILILPVTTLAAIAVLCIFVLYTNATNPVSEFDVDFYMALDGVRDLNRSAIGGGADAMDADIISTLPKLSPAEQLVGALFGPNSY